jgi:hypothetical protein
LHHANSETIKESMIPSLKPAYNNPLKCDVIAVINRIYKPKLLNDLKI